MITSDLDSIMTRVEQGEQDATMIAAFHNRLVACGLDEALVGNITYQYAIHLYLSTREHAARAAQRKPE